MLVARTRSPALMRRLCGRHQQYPIQMKPGNRLAGDFEVRSVNRIERSTENRDSHFRSMVTEWTRTSLTGRSCAPRATTEIFFTTSYPSVTSPNTLCLLSSQGVGATVTKNWLPLVL